LPIYSVVVILAIVERGAWCLLPRVSDYESVEMARYVELRRHTDADGDVLEGDWIKAGSWDLRARSVDELREWLMGECVSVEQFKTWPVYLGNVDRPGMEWLRDL
jgi:hypothetical protein